jgi:glycosyltransferase involved in cell wall biosynthesis
MPRLLKIGYTTIDQAVAKGVVDLAQPDSIMLYYNCGNFFEDVLYLVPFGKKNVSTQLTQTVRYQEVAFAPRANKYFAALLHLKRMRTLVNTLLDSFRPDVVQICGPHVPAVLALASSRLRKGPTVCFIEAYWEDILASQNYFPGFVRRLLPLWYRWVYRAFDIYTGAPSLSPDYYSAKGMARDRIAAWVQEFDLRVVDAVPDAEAPEELLSAQRPLICTVGRLHPEKLPGDVVRIFAGAVANGRPGTLALVGDGSERAALEKYVAENGIESRVIFLGQLPLRRAIATMKACDLMIAPMQGTALVEAMASELAIVAYDHETHRAHIRDSINGRLVPHQDVAAAAEAVRALIDRPDERRRLARAARDYVRERYSFEQVAAIMRDGFCRALATRS